ncbi:MAG: hypothetical protein AAGF66_09340 [Cyanobacteria bacterium P01_H01_bin.119]
MARLTSTLKLSALVLSLGVLSLSATAQAQSTSADPLQTRDNAPVGGGSENVLTNPFDLFHEAVLSGGTNRDQYREQSAEQIDEAAAEFRQQNGVGQQPFGFEYESAPDNAVEAGVIDGE